MKIRIAPSRAAVVRQPFLTLWYLSHLFPFYFLVMFKSALQSAESEAGFYFRLRLGAAFYVCLHDAAES